MLKKQGYDGVELPIFELDVDALREGRQVARRSGPRVARPSPAAAATTTRRSPDAKVRAAGVANNKLVLDCCQAVGATILAGPYHSALGYFTGSGPTADEWKWAVDSMRQVAEHAAKANVTLAVEYLNRFECYLLDERRRHCAQFCKDVNHPELPDDVRHVPRQHRREARRRGDQGVQRLHGPRPHFGERPRARPAHGHIAWDETFDTLKETGYDGWMMVEAFGLALPALAAATKIWRQMFDSEEQLAATRWRS